MKLYLLSLKKDLVRTGFYTATLQTEQGEATGSIHPVEFANFYISMSDDEVNSSTIKQIELAATEKIKKILL